MDRLISEQAVIDAIDKWVKNMGVLIALPANEVTPLFDSIRDLPSETGHWEWLTEDKYRCSNCNSETRVDECMNEPMYEFCPFCGARMECEG